MICALVLWFPCLAADGTWKLTRIATTGSKEYTTEEIVGASGLKTGSSVGVSDFKKASEKLAKSGACARVTHRYETQGGNVSVTFEIVDAEKRFPIR